MPAVETAPPREVLELHESVTLVEQDGGAVFDEQGRVPIHIIRPTVGRGRGRHLYEADMLEANAENFAGWRMYIDHLSPAARKAADGLPRSVRDLGGRIVESYWDPSVPADPERGYGQGAVVGLAKPVPFIRELVENDPELIEASISATATGVRQIVGPNGQRVWLVEGINPRGSVDWVTEAGAGGRVAPLLEAAYADDDAVELALLESLSDEEVRDYLRENRPELVEAESGDGDGEGDGDGKDGDDDEAAVKKYEKKGLPRKLAEKAAKREQVSEADEGGDMPINREELQEALSENPDLMVAALQESAALQGYVETLVEAKMEEREEVIRAAATADARREIVLRDLRDEAHGIINEAKLPESWKSDLRAEYDLTEGKPTEALNLSDEADEDGKVTKTASEQLRESLDQRIERERTRLAEVAPTRVRNQGPSATTKPEGEKLEEGKEQEKPSHKNSGWGRFLQEAGVDPDAAYARAE